MVFHVEHEVDLMMLRLAGIKDALVNKQQVFGSNALAGFFEKLSFDRGGGRFTKLDVSAGEVQVAVLQVLTEQDARAAEQHAPGDDFNVPSPRDVATGCSTWNSALSWSRRPGCLANLGGFDRLGILSNLLSHIENTRGDMIWVESNGYTLWGRVYSARNRLDF